MKKVFISGCYDIIHGGHVQFFNEAKALGDYLIVCIASDDVLWMEKKRKSSLPNEHKISVIQSLEMVNEVVVGEIMEMGLDFKDHFLRIKPDILVVTKDDKYEKIKRELCAQTGTEYHVLPKTPPTFNPVSTSGIINQIQAPQEVPLRVDFAGGWLDVPKLSKKGGFIVNCAISPTVSLNNWDYEKRSGMGGSGAWAILNGKDGVESELDLGVGWQDPAIIRETGLCVWNSGIKPELHLKRNGDMLKGLMAIYYCEDDHDTPSIVDKNRNYDLIFNAGKVAHEAVIHEDLDKLAKAIQMSYNVQLSEGMSPLLDIENCLAYKYCGGGWGGYALYLFSSNLDRKKFVNDHPHAKAIEPFLNL